MQPPLPQAWGPALMFVRIFMGFSFSRTLQFKKHLRLSHTAAAAARVRTSFDIRFDFHCLAPYACD
jgi:hypothetical protein